MEVTDSEKAKAILRCSNHSCMSSREGDSLGNISEELVFELGCEGWVRVFARETKRTNYGKSMG